MVAMSERVNPALQEALRDVGRPTTPEELSRRGVRRVRSVGMQEISLLIERAVNRTLIERTERVSEAELADLVQAAQSDFTEQLQGLRDLSDSQELIEKHKREWNASLSELRGTVQARRGFVDVPDAAAEEAEALVAEARGKELRVAVERIVRSGIRQTGAPETLTEELSARLCNPLLALLEERMQGEREELLRKHDHEASLLERRVAKLVGSLEKTERALGQAANARAADLGIASIYRDVQGLDDSEREQELKSALMSRIFEANLALRSQVGPEDGA